MKESPLLKKNSHVYLIDGTGDVDQVTQVGYGALTVTFKQPRGVRHLPATLRGKPPRRGEVMKSHDRLKTVLVTGCEHSTVVLQLPQ